MGSRILLRKTRRINMDERLVQFDEKMQKTMNNLSEEFLAGFDMAADSVQADDVSEAALAAAHELFGE
jgi:hypothetical protein